MLIPLSRVSSGARLLHAVSRRNARWFTDSTGNHRNNYEENAKPSIDHGSDQILEESGDTKALRHSSLSRRLAAGRAGAPITPTHNAEKSHNSRAPQLPMPGSFKHNKSPKRVEVSGKPGVGENVAISSTPPSQRPRRKSFGRLRQPNSTQSPNVEPGALGDTKLSDGPRKFGHIRSKPQDVPLSTSGYHRSPSNTTQPLSPNSTLSFKAPDSRPGRRRRRLNLDGKQHDTTGASIVRRETPKWIIQGLKRLKEQPLMPSSYDLSPIEQAKFMADLKKGQERTSPGLFPRPYTKFTHGRILSSNPQYRKSQIPFAAVVIANNPTANSRSRFIMANTIGNLTVNRRKPISI